MPGGQLRPACSVGTVLRRLEVIGNEVTDLRAAEPSPQGTLQGFGLAGVRDAVIAHNSVRGIEGRHAGARDSEAYGFRVVDSTLTLRGSLVTNLSGYIAGAFAAWTGTTLTVDGATVDGMTTSEYYATALHTNTEPWSHIEARNCIIMNLSSGVAVHHGGGSRSTADIEWSVLWGIGGAHEAVRPGDGLLTAEPAFALLPRDAYHLADGSPGVDEGKPGADCSREPAAEDGSCLADAGHLSNTKYAKTRAAD